MKEKKMEKSSPNNIHADTLAPRPSPGRRRSDGGTRRKTDKRFDQPSKTEAKSLGGRVGIRYAHRPRPAAEEEGDAIRTFFSFFAKRTSSETARHFRENKTGGGRAGKRGGIDAAAHRTHHHVRSSQVFPGKVPRAPGHVVRWRWWWSTRIRNDAHPHQAVTIPSSESRRVVVAGDDFRRRQR